MNFIFLLILIKFTLTKSDDDDEQKYIDLLPESEKQAFLDIVARRLFEAVKAQTGKSSQDLKSREIHEEELEEHADFVKRILAEESQNLRRSKDGIEDKSVTQIIKVDEDSKSEDYEGSSHIDLTLRNGKRIKRSNVEEKSNDNLKNDEIPVKVIYDNDTTTGKVVSDESADAADIQVKGVRRNGSDLKRNVRSHTVMADYNPSESSDNENEKVNSDSDETPIPSSYSKGTTESILDDEKSIEEKSDEDIETETTIAPLTTSSDTETTVPTEPTFEIVTTTTKIPTTSTQYRPPLIKLNILAKENMTNKANNGSVALKPKYLRAADDMVQNVSSFSETKLNNVSNIEDYTTTSTTEIEITLLSTDLPDTSEKPNGQNNVDKAEENNNLEPEVKYSNESYVNLDTNTTIVNEPDVDIVTSPSTLAPLVTTVWIDNTDVLKEDNNSISTNASLSDIKTIATKQENVNDLVKALRSGLAFQIEEFEEDNNGQVKPNPSLFHQQLAGIKKPYEVYEISLNDPPFVKKVAKTMRTQKRRQKSLNKEEPYYVPVYNYDPELVYFNAHNRLGPNFDDEEKDIRDDLAEENIESTKYIARNFNHPKNIAMKTKTKGKKDGPLRKFKFNRKPAKKNVYTKTKTKTRIDKPRSKVKMPLIIKSPKFAEIYFNPDDYLDMDYYFGLRKRNMRRKHFAKPHIGLFPDTEDEDHVANAMKSGNAKSHKSAVQQILYSRHIFGHIPALKSTTESPVNEELALQQGFLRSRDSDSDEGQEMYRNSVPEEDDDIAMDYYFGFEKQGARSRYKKVREAELPSLSNEEVQKELEEPEPTGPKKGTIKEILSIYPQDAFLHFDTLMQSKVPISRTIRDVVIRPYFNVLKDMVVANDEALVKYDWLGTTVDVQSALDKLLDLSEVLRNDETVHESDLQLFKYFQYLYETSKATLDETKPLRDLEEEEDEDRKNLLPKNKHRKKEYLKNKGLLQRVWLKRGSNEYFTSLHNKKNLAEVQAFLVKFSAGLFDLHTVLTNIATITKYKKQRWFQNLKELYLKDATEKQILEVLLHLVATRLFGLLEESAKDGLEKSYPVYIEKHEDKVLKTKDEFLLILKVLDELKRLEK